MKTSNIFCLIMTLLLALTLLTGAIAAPILCRPFYYAHIDALKLCEKTGYTEEEIREAFDEMMDYCLGGETFSCGILKWSESGKDHFTDVKKLFLLDVRAFALCSILVAVSAVYLLFVYRKPVRIGKHGPMFFAGTGLFALFAVIGIAVATDFNRAFIVFHQIFFPGKENWMFDPGVDEIINILPEIFFRNCGILILVLLLVGCILFIAADCMWIKGRNRSSDDSSGIGEAE